ncbi:MAG: hypothetical protein JWR52_2720 [Marmoricola sp.]|nr:hypothetical protein [Marmoricola sp.]
MSKPPVIVCERRIQAPVDAIWSVIVDPRSEAFKSRRSTIVETHGRLGEVGYRCTIGHSGGRRKIEFEVTESVVGERFVMLVRHRDGSVGQERTELQVDGDEVVLTLTYVSPPLPEVRTTSRLVRGFLAALVGLFSFAVRVALWRLCIRIERQAKGR